MTTTSTVLEQRLGREPLEREFTSAWLEERLRRRPGKIKSVLLDQGLIGGLGNIYVDESLFRAGIHPERRANTLTPEEVRRLHRAVRGVLRAAIDGRGTTFSSFEDAEGNRGRYGGRLLVYGRGDKGAVPTLRHAAGAIGRRRPRHVVLPPLPAVEG